MVGGQADVKLVSNAMANATRRKIMAMLVEKERTRVEVEQAAGASMLDYHLQMLQQAGLADIKEGVIVLTEFGKNFMETKAEKPAEARKDLSGTAPLQDHRGAAAICPALPMPPSFASSPGWSRIWAGP